MSKCICVKGFSVEKWDEDECPIDNEYITVDEDDIWEIDNITPNQVRIIDEHLTWIEIPLEFFNEHFRG